MYLNSDGCRVMDYHRNKSYRVYINASHVEIARVTTGGKRHVVFARGPADDTWYDEKHRAIVDAARALEKALIEATE